MDPTYLHNSKVDENSQKLAFCSEDFLLKFHVKPDFLSGTLMFSTRRTRIVTLFKSYNQTEPCFNKTRMTFDLLPLFCSHRQKITVWVYRCVSGGITIYNLYAATCKKWLLFNGSAATAATLSLVPITPRQIKRRGFQKALMHIN